MKKWIPGIGFIRFNSRTVIPFRGEFIVVSCSEIRVRDFWLMRDLPSRGRHKRRSMTMIAELSNGRVHVQKCSKIRWHKARWFKDKMYVSFEGVNNAL